MTSAGVDNCALPTLSQKREKDGHGISHGISHRISPVGELLLYPRSPTARDRGHPTRGSLGWVHPTLFANDAKRMGHDSLAADIEKIAHSSSVMLAGLNTARRENRRRLPVGRILRIYSHDE